METIFTLIGLLSLLAFVVGMFSPRTVIPSKWRQTRGRVALLYIGLFLVSMVIASRLSNTGTNDTASQEVANQAQDDLKEAAREEERELSMGDTIESGYFDYVVKNITFRKSVGNSLVSETADGIYMLVDLSVKNKDQETRIIDDSSFYVTDMNGVKYEYASNASTTLGMSGGKILFLKQCQPNITTNGVLIFEVPEKGDYYLYLSGGFGNGAPAKVLLK